MPRRKVAPDAVVVKPTPKHAAGSLDASHPMLGGRKISPLHADGRVPVYTNMQDFLRDFGHVAAEPTIDGICHTLAERARGARSKEFTNAVAWVNDVLVGTREEMGAETWNAVLSNRMDELLHDIVLRDDFLDESPPAVEDTLKCLVGVCQSVEMRANRKAEANAARRIMSRVPSVLQHFWDHRTRLYLRDDECPRTGTDPITILVTVYGLIYKMTNTSFPIILPQFMIHLWVNSTRRTQSLDDLLWSHRLTVNSMKARELFDENAYTHVTLVDGVGVDAYLARIVAELQRPDITIRGIEGCLASLKDLILDLSLRPAIEKHGVMPVVAKTLDVQGRWPKEDALRANVYKEASHILSWWTQKYFADLSAIDRSEVTARGGDVVDFLVRGLDLVAEGFHRMDKDDRHELRKDIQEYCIVATRMSNDPRPPVRVFLAGMKARARDEWWPCLSRLQSSPHRSDQREKLYSVLVDRWMDYGRALGFDAEKEQKRHKSVAKSRCTWRGCGYNTRAPPGKLLACKGCGEVQYCGRECQKSDWAQGGHKQHCGTRVKT
ncbi:unnamed protein product [Peniophora sp. CBMAI 1063]|nr:unnamed protein product [Peniophora sp. CBMAI 1063]